MLFLRNNLKSTLKNKRIFSNNCNLDIETKKNTNYVRNDTQFVYIKRL